MATSSAVKELKKKGEDAHVVLEGYGGTSCFAIFDGHGGTKACSHGVSKLAPELKALGTACSNAAIEDAFWAADAELGVARVSDGSTGTVLLVDSADDGGLQCVLAWVGDSQGAVVDLSAAAICGSTTRHVADDPAEERRLTHTWQISRQLRLDKALPKDGSAPSLAAVRKAVDALGFEVDDADASVVARAIERGNRMDANRFGKMDALAEGVTSVLAPRVPGGKNFVHKLATPIAEGDESNHGSSTTSTATTASTATVGASVSTACTRALGDWECVLSPRTGATLHATRRPGPCFRGGC